MGGERVITAIDRMVDYLEENGEMETHALAKTMSVDESVVKTWAYALEDAELVKVTSSHE